MMPRIPTTMALLAGVLLLSACTRITEAGFRQKMDRFIGMPKEALIRAFGAPIREGSLSNGPRYAMFSQSWVERGGGYMTQDPRTETVSGTIRDDRGKKKSYTETRTVYVDRWVPPYAYDRPCVVNFAFNAADRVSTYVYRGSGCVGVEKDE